MMHTYRELVIDGVMIAPIVSYLAATLVLIALHRIFRLIQRSAYRGAQPLYRDLWPVDVAVLRRQLCKALVLKI
jgi:hypothetical protein